MTSRRAEQGLALVTVVLVLVALALVAAPFALSMRQLESGALLSFQRERARAGADVALAAARRHLEDTHPYYDGETPHFDGREEVEPADLSERYAELLPRDPRGAIRSASVEDERGKVHLGTASYFLLGNLLGGRTTLSAAVDDRATTFAVADGDGWPDSGLALVGREQIFFEESSDDTLDQVTRGFASTHLRRPIRSGHAAGAEILDARLLLLVQRGWKLRPGVFEPFRRIDGIKDLSLFSELAYTAEELDRVRDDLTVYGWPVRWNDPRRVLGVESARDGGRHLVVDDGSRFGPGTVVRLEAPGHALEYDVVVAAVPWGDRWHLRLLEGPSGRHHGEGATIVRSLARTPVNVATASVRVLTALLTGLGRQPVTDVVTAEEAARIALAIVDGEVEPTERELADHLASELAEGRLLRADLARAAAHLAQIDEPVVTLSAAELTEELAGLQTRRSSRRLSATRAAELALRLHGTPPSSHEDLATILATAAAEGLCTDDERVTILRNAVDAGDARIVGGTAPFTYASDGVFTLRGAAIENSRSGRERARVEVRQVTSVAAPGTSARLFTTQTDFEEGDRALGGGRGWSSFPVPLGEGPLRADGLAAGDEGPSREERGSFVSVKPVRSALPGTRHLDGAELDAQRRSPSGFEVGDGVALEIPTLDAAVTVVDSDDRLRPFAVELWFEVEDTQAETILFDGGDDALRDRVLVMLRRGELLLRVSDISEPDFDAQLPEGRLPPAGEIRYAFDDGLELLPGVPYHVLAWIGGARDSSLALWVDGRPRGDRSFTTRLSAPVTTGGGAAFAGPAQGSLRLSVESTVGFPERGAIRVGEEIMEYVEKSDTAFHVTPDGSRDPFGGRARRGTVGRDHEASEIVELVGYTRPLASLVAATAAGALDGDLGPFQLAQVDGSRLTDTISFDPIEVNAPSDNILEVMGTGLLADEDTIPVVGLDGVAAVQDVFQSGGGYAILFCDYGFDDLVGQQYTTLGASPVLQQIPATTAGATTAFLGGAEIVRYESFDGRSLLGCQRAGDGIPDGSPLLGAAQGPYVRGGSNSWASPRDYVTTFSTFILDVVDGLPDTARVLIIPVSVQVTGDPPNEGYHPGIEADSYLVQIGLDFPDEGGGTEWVRWTTATDAAFVRDDPGALNDALTAAAAAESWRGDRAVGDDLVEIVDDQLEFRGQSGTEDVAHVGGDDVLPVHVFGGWGVENFDPELGVPGRHDVVTFVGDDERTELAVINYATTQDSGWGPAFCLVGLRAPLLGDFERTPEEERESYVDREYDFDAALRPGGVGERVAKTAGLSGKESLADHVRRFAVDSRRLTRLVKAPSGELPTAPIRSFHAGQSFEGRPSPGRATVDELRLHATDVPGPLLPPVARYLLAHELEFDEEDVLELEVAALDYPHARLRGGTLGADQLEILGELPAGGGLLRIGEEIVSYAGLDATGTGAVFLTGRGLYGTTRAHHVRWEPVTPLLFWPASPLRSRLTEDGATIPVADASRFPAAGGLVWVGDELVGYTAVTDEGLTMPSRAGRSEWGLLRGRFGTGVDEHRAGAIVRWQPERHRDRALLGDDVPESELYALQLRAPGAFFTELAVRTAERPAGVELVGRVVLDGRTSPHDDVAAWPELLALPARDAASGAHLLSVARQADVLELYLGARWADGAFDARRGASSAWKLAPRVDAVVVQGIEPTRVLEHEEW